VSLRSLFGRLRQAILGSGRPCAGGLVSLERPRYFAGRLLTPEDLADEQDYFRERLRRHNRLLHGWGIVSGLEVEPAGSCTVTISPGYALDPSGEEIVVPEPTRHDVCKAGLVEGATGYLAVRYAEEDLAPVATEGAAEATRIREGFELAVRAGPPWGEEPWVLLAEVTLAGREVSVETAHRRYVPG
jgi:hypothetical protein